jgi:hypothetical protein
MWASLNPWEITSRPFYRPTCQYMKLEIQEEYLPKRGTVTFPNRYK